MVKVTLLAKRDLVLTNNSDTDEQVSKLRSLSRVHDRCPSWDHLNRSIGRFGPLI